MTSYNNISSDEKVKSLLNKPQNDQNFALRSSRHERLLRAVSKADSKKTIN